MGHFYSSQGKTHYTTKGANGKRRDSTLRDAKKHGWYPSVTTVISAAAKPGLDKWKAEQTVLACNTEDWQKVGEKWDDYVKRVVYASMTMSRKAASRGDELHNSLEKYFIDGSIDPEHADYTGPVIECLQDTFGKYGTWKPEESFGHPFGFGGKVDLNCGGYIVDFKTKNSADIKKFVTYDEHLMQLAAYRVGLNRPKAECYNLFFSSIEPGVIKLHKWTEEELQRGWEMFKALLKYWQLSNNYMTEVELC